MQELFKYILENQANIKLSSRIKLILGLPISNDKLSYELRYERGLYLTNTIVSSLPDNLNIKGILYLKNTKMTKLPNNLVAYAMDIRDTDINILPDSLDIGLIFVDKNKEEYFKNNFPKFTNKIKTI